MFGQVSGVNDFLAIPAGMKAGYSAINKFGANADLLADTWETVWDGGGLYVYPSGVDVVAVHQVADQADLRGARINVQGLDANWNLVLQDVYLDATSTANSVVLTTPLRRIFRMIVYGAACTSDIVATNTTSTITYAQVSTGMNQTLMAVYTVPAGKTAYITNYYCSVTRSTAKDPNGVLFYLMAKDATSGDAPTIKHLMALPKQSSPFEFEFMPYARFSEKTDIQINAYALDNTGSVTSGFNIVLIDN